MVETRSKHAPGWKWRKHNVGRIDHPWSPDQPTQVQGLCEKGWHGDCPQRAGVEPTLFGQCSCSCHRVPDHAALASTEQVPLW